jgi:ATP-dependent RNA helicase DeaD
MTPPSVAELVELKKAQLVKDVYRVLAVEEDNQLFESTIGQMLTEGLTIEQIALGLIKMNMGETVKELKEQDFGIEAYGARREGSRDGGRDGGRGDRFGRGERGSSDRLGRGERESGGRFERGGERRERFSDRREGGARFAPRSENAPREFERRGPREERTRDANMTRLFLNLGNKDRIRPNDIVGAIAGETGVPGKSIGGIDIFDNFSFVDVPQKDAEHVIKVMKNNTIKGKSVNMEISKG